MHSERRLKPLTIVLAVFIAILSGALIFVLFGQTTKPDQVTEKISQHMILPSEKPVIAEVTDVEKLESSLKKVAQKNDYVLVYSNAQKVIIYRPSIDKVVDVQPIIYGKKPNASLNKTVAIYDGSGNKEKLTAFISSVYGAFPNVQLIVKEDAPRAFPETIVYTRENTSYLSDQLAETLSIKAGSAPLGMPDDSADITFIVGENYKVKE